MSAVLTQVLYLEASTLQNLQVLTNETMTYLEDQGYGIKSHTLHVDLARTWHIACIVYGKGPTVMHQNHR